MKKNKGRSIKAIPKQYDPAPEVEEIAKDLIRQYHPHLAVKLDKMKFLFVNKKIKAKGKIVAGVVKKVPKEYQVISDGVEIVIIISYPVFNELSEQLKCYIVDHELNHIFYEDHETTGEEKCTLLSHDFEDFIEIIDRYGPVRKEIKQLQLILARKSNDKEDLEEDD